MKDVITLSLLIFMSYQYLAWRKETGGFSREKEVSDGCGACIAVAIVIFLLLTLAFMPQLMEAVGKKFIE